MLPYNIGGETNKFLKKIKKNLSEFKNVKIYFTSQSSSNTFSDSAPMKILVQTHWATCMIFVTKMTIFLRKIA